MKEQIRRTAGNRARANLERLGKLLSNPAFVAQTFSEATPPGRRVLYHDPETDFYVLAHVQEGRKTGKPHSHGASWAIYGNAREHTDMTEWRCVNPESEDHAVLEPVSGYRLGPGRTKAYGPGVIHSTAHPEKAWVIRVTGTDLERGAALSLQEARPDVGEGVTQVRIWATPPSTALAAIVTLRRLGRDIALGDIALERGAVARRRIPTAAATGALQQKAFARL
jgi:hypothetical protein